MKRSAAISVLGAAILATRVEVEAQSPVVLKAAGVPEESATPVLWAEQTGLFRRHGLNVDLDPQRSGTVIASGVAGGAYQIGKSSIIPLITAFAKGIPFVLVAPGGLYRAAKPHIAMIVAADSPIRTAAEMNGKTLGVSALDDLYTLGIRWWMDKNGGDSSTLRSSNCLFQPLPTRSYRGGSTPAEARRRRCRRRWKPARYACSPICSMRSRRS